MNAMLLLCRLRRMSIALIDAILWMLGPPSGAFFAIGGLMLFGKRYDITLYMTFTRNAYERIYILMGALYVLWITALGCWLLSRILRRMTGGRLNGK